MRRGAARGGLPPQAPRLSGCGEGELFLAFELYVWTVRRTRDFAVGKVFRPACVSGGGVDAGVAAGRFAGPSAMRPVRHPGTHIEALADVVAGGFSIDAVLAVGA